MPNDDVQQAHEAMVATWSALQDSERSHMLPTTSAPDAGMAWMMHRWASGQRLELVLRDSEIGAGDFVRRCKQVVDLLGQIGDAALERTLAVTARRAIDAVMRGVVAADRID
jgi:ATP-dependent RNA helicase HelY